MRSLLLIVLLSAPAAAERLRMKFEESTNLHMANQRGAINWFSDIEVSIDLDTQGTAIVRAVGETKEHHLDVINNSSYNTDDIARWKTSWRGTYKRGKDTLAFDLDLTKHDCNSERVENGRSTAKTCETPTKKATIACTTATVDVEPARGKAVPTKVWACHTTGTSELAETPAGWTLGKDRCIAVRGGHMGANTFVRCP